MQDCRVSSLRGLPPAPQNFHVESWTPPSYVSADIDENVLRFRPRYYLEAIPEDLDDPTPADKKVVLQVTVSQLGLSQPETRRLKAVAGSRYHPKNDELLLVSRKYREPHRNKADLRKTLGLLVEDATESYFPAFKQATLDMVVAQGGIVGWTATAGRRCRFAVSPRSVVTLLL